MQQPSISASGAAQYAQEEATQAILRAIEAYVTLDDAPAPLFKIGEKICYNGRLGGTILSSKWMETHGEFSYNILSLCYNPPACVEKIKESQIKSSRYTVGDVVLVEAFDKQVRRTIVRVLVDASGVFTYDVGAGFEARDKDVLEVVGRRAKYH